ncbi:MAG: hypothetical protein K6F82_02410 [Sphaerochaetaceae bacterium]|nr:hypothetical protein [Sphaerochaetaceae bacterium]
MRRRFSAFLSVLLLMYTSVFAASGENLSVNYISPKEINETMGVIVDTVTAAFVANYGKTKVELPSMAISSTERGLPTRVSFFLADPASFTRNISKALNLDNTDFFSAIFSSINSGVSDPLLSAVYYSLLSKNYQTGDYLISGTILIDYPDNLDNLSIDEIIRATLTDENPIILRSNLSVYGARLFQPVSIAGKFTLTAEDGTHIVIKPVSDYTINDDTVSGGEFRF